MSLITESFNTTENLTLFLKQTKTYNKVCDIISDALASCGGGVLKCWLCGGGGGGVVVVAVVWLCWWCGGGGGVVVLVVWWWWCVKLHWPMYCIS